MPLARIRRLLVEGGAKRLSADYPLWELSPPWWPFWRRAHRFEALQAEILAALSTLAGVAHLVIDLNPQDFDVGGTWTHAHKGTFRVPEDCDPAALNARVLAVGHWSLYASYEPVDPELIPDAFTVRPDQVAVFALTHSVTLLVQSSSGNASWRLWVEAVETPQEAAA